jgi:hypothetical protein
MRDLGLLRLRVMLMEMKTFGRDSRALYKFDQHDHDEGLGGTFSRAYLITMTPS